MKKMMRPVSIPLVFLVVLSFVLAGCKPSVTGRLAGGVPPLRYQQLFACEQGGRPMIACRTDSAITVEQYRALVAQAGGQDEQPPNEPEQDEQPPAPPGGDEGDQGGAPPGPGAGKVAGEACANNDECAAGLKCMYQVCQTQSCTETDAENLPLVAGVVTLDNSVTEDVLKKDECVNENQIKEWFCSPNSGASARMIACPPDTTCQLNAEGVALCQAGAPPAGAGAGKAAGEVCAHNDE